MTGSPRLPGAGPLIAAPLSPDCRACVVIPVRDEATTLETTLVALAGQVDLHGRPFARSGFELIVLANNCRDGSADVARRFGARSPSFALHVVEVDLPADSAHVGTARRLLMDEACHRLLGLGFDRGVIASTDGDTRVAPNWLAAIQAEVAAGADAVGGDVRTDRAGRLALGRQARGAYLVDVAYRRLVDELEARLDPDPADPWPRHHHHTGASLAVTAGAYRRAGGLPPLPSSEDLAFVAALRLLDLRVRHGLGVRVVTSTRRLGRAGGGMADTLRQWSVSGSPSRVEDPAATEARIVLRHRLRGLWRASRIGGGTGHTWGSVAEDLGLDGPTLARMIEKAPTFGMLAESVGLEGLRVIPGPAATIEMDAAVSILSTRLASLRHPDPTPSAASHLFEEVEPISLLPTVAEVA